MLDLNTMVLYLENMIEGTKYYYDKVTDNIVELDMKYVALADKYISGDKLLEYSEWERDAVLETIHFLKNYNNYVELPDKYEVDEYRLMARFCCTRKKKRIINKLTDALMGKEPIRKFNEVVRKLKIVNEWNEYKLDELIKVSKDWCEKNDIKYIV